MNSRLVGYRCSICKYGYFGLGSLVLKRKCEKQVLRTQRFNNGDIVTRRRFRKRKSPPKYEIVKVTVTHGEKQTFDRKKVVSHVYLYKIVLLSNPRIAHEVFEKKITAVK